MGYSGPMTKRIAIGVIWHGKHILIGRRPRQLVLGGYWELPGGKLQPGETPEACLRREVREEVGLEVEVGEELIRVHHDYPDFSIDLIAFICQAASADAQPIACEEVRWVRPEDLADYTFPPANRAILEAIQRSVYR